MGAVRSTVEADLERDGGRRILDEAARRFQESGYAETSLRDVAAGAGMKAGSLYYHFESKEALLIAILERGMSYMVDAFDMVADRRVVAGSDPDHDAAFSRLADHVAAHLSALHGNRAYTAAHVTLFRTAPKSVRRAVVPIRDNYERSWTELLASLLPERDPKEISMLRLALFGAMNASVEWLDAGRGNIDQFAELVAEQFWFGVVERPASLGDGRKE